MSVCTYARLCAYVCVCVFACAQASETAPQYFIGINNRSVSLRQFTQSVFLYHRQTPYCYCLAQKLTWREKQSEIDRGKERRRSGEEVKKMIEKKGRENTVIMT